MILSLVTIDLHMECRKFSCWLADLGCALDVASQITNKSYKLLKVSITEEDGSRTFLPIAIFDGASFSGPMKQLETQWQAVLSKPINQKSVHTQWLIGVARQHITFQQNRVDKLTEAIHRINQHWSPLEQKEEGAEYPSDGLSRYIARVGLYQRQLVCAQHYHAVATSRLSELQARI